VGDLTIRAVQLAHPDGGAHEAGDEVELTMAIANGGAVDDRLVGVTGPGSAVAAVGDPATAANPGSSPDPVDGRAHRTQPAADGAAVDVLLPAGEAVHVGSDVPAVVLSGLDRRIDAAQSVALTLTFARAGEVSVRAVVGPPSDVLPRGPVHDFHGHGS
jgi:copper(I)-binding protein